MVQFQVHKNDITQTRLVASGPKDEVFTTDNLQDAYGGRLSVLSRIGDLMKREEVQMKQGPGE